MGVKRVGQVIRVRPEAIEALCAQARRGLSNLTPQGWRAVLEAVVDEIRVLPDRRFELHGELLPPQTSESPILARALLIGA